MNGNFKQCARGHFYSVQLSSCPYCPSSDEYQSTSNFEGHPLQGDNQPTVTPEENISLDNDANKTSLINEDPNATIEQSKNSGEKEVNHTIFFDEMEDESGKKHIEVRSRRKLVGWLVSYTLDEMGTDFRLYEGRNVIGRKVDCQITISDNTVSGQHAVVLFRNGKFSVTDMQSSQGTFVNDEDIELDPRYLNDGDTIRIGRTLLKFRSAL